MSLAQSTLVQRIRYELGDRPWEDTGTASSGSSTITGASTGDWVEGDIGEFVTDGDTFRTVSETGGEITATRSYWGTTGAAHGASSRILKNPRYAHVEIVNAISAVIQDKLWPLAWKKVADTITPNPTVTLWYDLAADARAIIRAIQLYGATDQIVGFYGVRHAAPRIIFERNLDTSLVTSGVGVMFPDGFYHQTNAVSVDYAAKITDATTAGPSYPDISDGDAVVEAIIYGAVSHLEAALENRKPRKPRQDRETLRGASMYDRMFREALNRANQELRDTIPIMRRVRHY